MKNVLASSLLVALVIAASSGNAQDQPQDAAAQSALVDALKLAPEHAVLKNHLGNWTTESKTYFADPGNPTVTKGTATFSALMGGRYLRQTYKGEFFGMPFEGFGLTGYDKTKKKYVSSWIDNFETGILTMEGTYDEKTKTMTESGISHTTEGKVAMRNVTKQVDKDTFVFSMYMGQPDGKEALGMEITYRRVK